MRTSFYIIAGGFFVGVLTRTFFTVPLYGVLFIFSLILTLAIIFFLGVGSRNILYAVLFLGTLCIGGIQTELAVREFEKGLVLEEGEKLSTTGVIDRERDERESYALLVVRLEEYEHTRLRIKVPLVPTFSYGERVEVEGRVHVPEKFMTETGREFDYHAYLMKEGIQYELQYAEVVSLRENVGNSLVRFLLRIKEVWLGGLEKSMTEPHVSLVGGLVVGAKQSLGSELLTSFRNAGLIHIVVLSGYNLTLVAMWIYALTNRFSKKVRLALGTLGIIFFAILVGGGATVVRASTMAILGLFVTYVGYTYHLFRALTLAAVTMVFFSPFILVYDASFQLSCIATAGLIGISPYLLPYLTYVPVSFGFRDIVAATLATQLAVFPLILYLTGSLSLVAPLVNMIVLPIIPFTMGVGFVTGVLGAVFLPIAYLSAFITTLCTTYIFSMAQFFSSLSISTFTVSPFSPLILLIMYGVLAVALTFGLKKPLDVERS